VKRFDTAIAALAASDIGSLCRSTTDPLRSRNSTASVPLRWVGGCWGDIGHHQIAFPAAVFL